MAFFASLGSSHDVVLVLWLQTDRQTERGSVSEDDGGREEEVGGTLAEERRAPKTPEIKEENEKRFRLAKHNQFLERASLAVEETGPWEQQHQRDMTKEKGGRGGDQSRGSSGPALTFSTISPMPGNKR